MKDDLYSDADEVQSNNVDWGKIGDFINGTLVDRDNVTTTYGDKMLYTVRADGGSFHAVAKDKSIAKTATEIKAGDLWTVWGRNKIFDAQMKEIKDGQKFGLLFAETKSSQHGNDAKIIKVRTKGVMDTEYTSGDDVASGDVPM